MRATEDIMQVWRKFNDFPMETLTKAWHSLIDPECKQRTTDVMKEHRALYGTSGNCFDLAIWLIDEFRQNKVPCYGVLTEHLHVAVVAINEEGNKYFCDLGDQWIEPILLEPGHEAYTEEFVDGFFPGSRIKLNTRANRLLVTYRRPNGKESSQEFDLTPVSDKALIIAGQKTQRLFSDPLVEKRIFTDQRVLHWEFDNFESYLSSKEGRKVEPQLKGIEEWAERIHTMSGIHVEVVVRALEVYLKKSSQS
jgi:hypothetical protein